MDDVVVVGGGIVGLATGYVLVQSRPGLKVRVLEKESRLAFHQTGRNSGVVHSGIYYKPGSLKATLCREGRHLLEPFCQAHSVPFERCGKVIVATSSRQLGALENIELRGKANEIDCSRITLDRLAELEPHTKGVAALHVRDTGIVDFPAMCEALASEIQAAEGAVITSARAVGFKKVSSGYVIESTAGSFETRFLVNCCGLQSDRIARLAGLKPAARIMPVRGEYYSLREQAWGLCRNLIYPVPNPDFPFLGVHFTRMVGGGVECGPNAVLALGREAYSKAGMRFGDVAEMLCTLGFWKMGMRMWRHGLGEAYRSWSKRAFVRALQELVPDVSVADLEPREPGIRAQALGPNGKLLDDFVIEEADNAVHVINAPSPAATASLAIGNRIAALVRLH